MIGNHSPSGSSTGTGFIVQVATSGGDLHFLVTNKHVIDGAENVEFLLPRADANGQHLGGVRTTVTNFDQYPVFRHPDASVDIAVIPFSAILSNMSDVPFFRSIGLDLFATQDTLASLDAVEEVTFIGYPAGIFDGVNALPVARRGTTATSAEVDYNGLPTFLVDAAVYPGSSGSPVLLFDSGLYRDRTGNVTVGSRLSLLGIIAQVHTSALISQLVNTSPSFGVAQSPIGLGIVFKATAIRELIESATQALGFSLIDSQSAAVETSDGPSEADKEAIGQTSSSD